ncbi:MAG: tRNA pseudouridine(13) synthase TruD [Myxococcota bacterium]|nr:tRNA pseudouridine(13) synthase TruD [Myxococcota bacterium]
MNLPFLTADLPGTGGVLRSTEDDFVVDEVPAYAATGAGEHVFIKIEKRGLTTPRAVQLIARALRIRDRDIGVAGMKDRHAVTRQWLSLPPPITPEAATALALEPDAGATLRVLEAVRHPHKLRTGHVRGNRFELRVRQVADDAVVCARTILDRLGEPPGAPNWYGEQRFGRDRDNASRGRALVLGEQPLGRDRRLDRLMVSALQSELFNAWLVARLTDGLYRRVLAGDVLHKVGGGMFTCEAPAVDEPRLLAGELVVTGPMFGERMRRPPTDSPAGRREADILAAAGLAPDAFARVAAIAEGTRRDATIAVADITVAAGSDATLEVAFALPGGAYATVVMREVMKPPEAVIAREEIPTIDVVDDAPEPT